MNMLFSRWGDWSGVEHHEDPVCSIHSHLHSPAALKGESSVYSDNVCILLSAYWQDVSFTLPHLIVCPRLSVSAQEAASLSMDSGLGGGRSLLQARGGYRERERRIKEKAGTYPPVEFKVEWLSCIILWHLIATWVSSSNLGDILFYFIFVNKSHEKAKTNDELIY